MHKTICPHCQQPSYSSATVTQVWDCPYCGKPFLAEEGEELGRFVDDAGRERGKTEGA
ncbi:MAG TPA: hypothetical protein VIK93_09925 [Limnochordales bacterium]